MSNNNNTIINDGAVWHGTIVDANNNELLTYNRCCLTTIDNPFDPLTQFVEWFMFDVEKGYNSCGVLARICPEDDTLSEPEKWKTIEEAIDFIVLNDPLSIRAKIIEGKTYSYPLASVD